VYQILLILSLYVPSLVLFWIAKVTLKDTISLVYPFYDHESNKLFSKRVLGGVTSPREDAPLIQPDLEFGGEE
jgi:hypothetical protein